MANGSGTITVARVDDGERRAWDGFVASRSEADVLQTWAWGEASRLAGERPIRLAARTGDGRVVGVAQALVRASLLGRTIAYVPRGPVWDRAAPESAAAFGALLDALRDLGRAERAIVVKVDPASLRSGPTDGEDVRARLLGAGLRAARHDLQARSTILVPLDGGGEAAAARWDWYARNRWKRSLKAGIEVTVDRGPDPGSISALTDLLASTADRGHFRARSGSFLSKLAAELTGDGGWYLAVGRLDGRPVAAMLAARVGDQAFYLYGGTARDESVAKAHVGYGTMGTLIRKLADDGVARLDLWGIYDPRDPDADPGWQGFTRFKRNFSDVELRHPGTFDLVIDQAWYRIRELRERIGDVVRRRSAKDRG